jgi:aquaporin Z
MVRPQRGREEEDHVETALEGSAIERWFGEKVGQRAAAEFVGTFALVFIGAGSVIMLRFGIGLLGVAIAHGLVLAIMVSVTAHISGGHINPAVTIGAWVTNQIRTGLALVYIGAQVAGAVAGAYLLRAAIPESLWRPAHLGAPLVNHPGMSNGKAVLLEAILTFFLVFAVYGTAIDTRGPFAKTAGLTIGLVLTFDILVGGALTGASMNPARTLGPEIGSGTYTDWWVWWIGPIAGGVIAAFVYWFAFLEGREKLARAPKTEQPIGGGPESDQQDLDRP